MSTAGVLEWSPTFEPWRHGGWYVTNTRYPSGACGCVSNNFADRKWRIVCSPTDLTQLTFSTRGDAAKAEHAFVIALGAKAPATGPAAQEQPLHELRVTRDEYRATWQALAQYVENGRCSDAEDPHDDPLLVAAESLSSRMDAEIAKLAE
ncbi:MAG: hypothetical protein ACHREM_00940 [Polyangiales bacterium]